MNFKEFSKHSGLYWRNFLGKIQDETPLVTSPGVYIILDKVQFEGVATPKDMETKFKKGNSILLPLKGGGTEKLTAIAKSNVKDDSRKAYNLGNVAEGVIACAMAARFISKNEVITSRHVWNVINQMRQRLNGTTSIRTFRSLNMKGPHLRKNLYDDVTVTIRLAEANISMLFSDDVEEKEILASLMLPCISYANSYEIATAAKIMYENGVKDYIEIIADGETDQKGTKVDVNLIINEMKEIEIPAHMERGGTKLRLTQISLKKDVNQFAQVGGWELDKMQNFWGKILNVQLSSQNAVQTIYEKDAAILGETATNVAAVMRDLYKWAHSDLERKLTNPHWIEHFIDTLDDFATYKEEYVQLIEIKTTTNTFERYNFKQLRVPLLGRSDLDVPPNLRLQSTYSESSPRGGGAPLPMVTISALNTNDNKVYDLIKFRHKLEKGTGSKPKAIRNYVEKQKGLHQYVGG